jgi:hypothetical protein
MRTHSVVGESGTTYEINLSTSDNPDLVAVGAVIAAPNVSKADRQVETTGSRYKYRVDHLRYLLQRFFCEQDKTEPVISLEFRIKRKQQIDFPNDSIP